MSVSDRRKWWKRPGSDRMFIDDVEILLTAGELNNLQGLSASAIDINRIANKAAYVQELTASAAALDGSYGLRLNHATVAIAATLDATQHPGFFAIVNTSASGTAAHTVTLGASQTFDGTNNRATLNAPAKALLVIFDSTGKGSIVANTGTVTLSAV